MCKSKLTLGTGQAAIVSKPNAPKTPKTSDASFTRFKLELEAALCKFSVCWSCKNLAYKLIKDQNVPTVINCEKIFRSGVAEPA